MGPLDEAIQAGYSIVGVSTWFTFSVPDPGPGDMPGTRHLQVVYLQREADVKALYQKVNSRGRIQWELGDL